MPSWLGFIIGIAIGAALIVVGAVMHPVSIRLIAWGAWAVISFVLAWIAGATAVPAYTGQAFGQPTFGARVTNMPLWVWLIVLGLFIAATVIGFVV